MGVFQKYPFEIFNMKYWIVATLQLIQNIVHIIDRDISYKMTPSSSINVFKNGRYTTFK